MDAAGLTLQDGSGPLAALILAKVLLPGAECSLCSQGSEAGKLRPGLWSSAFFPSTSPLPSAIPCLWNCALGSQEGAHTPPALCQISRYCNYLKGLALPELSQAPLFLPAVPQLKFPWPSLEGRDFLKGIHMSQAQSSSRLLCFHSVAVFLFGSAQRRAAVLLAAAVAWGPLGAAKGTHGLKA